jgi:hypothetical protein
LEKNLSSATFSTTDRTWTDPGANPGLRVESPERNLLSHGKATDRRIGDHGKLERHIYILSLLQLLSVSVLAAEESEM